VVHPFGDDGEDIVVNIEIDDFWKFKPLCIIKPSFLSLELKWLVLCFSKKIAYTLPNLSFLGVACDIFILTELFIDSVMRLKANNTSPSFHWPEATNPDGSLMTADQKRAFLDEQGKYSQFNFTTYGGSVQTQVAAL
jgi:hypothetical protein